MILVVGKLSVGRDHIAIRSTHRCTEHRHAEDLFFPRDFLAIQSSPDAQRQDLPGCHIRSQVGIVVARQADDVGDDAEDRVRVDEEGIGFPAGWLDRQFPLPGGPLRSLALLARLGPGELQLQGKSLLPGGRVDQNEEIQVAIGDSEKGVGSRSSQPGDDQDRRKLNPVPLVWEDVGVGHPVAA